MLSARQAQVSGTRQAQASRVGLPPSVRDQPIQKSTSRGRDVGERSQHQVQASASTRHDLGERLHYGAPNETCNPSPAIFGVGVGQMQPRNPSQRPTAYMNRGHSVPEVPRSQMKPVYRPQQVTASRNIERPDQKARQDFVPQDSPPQRDIPSSAPGSQTRLRSHRKVTDFLRSYKPSSNSAKRLAKVTHKIAPAQGSDILLRDPVQYEEPPSPLPSPVPSSEPSSEPSPEPSWASSRTSSPEPKSFQQTTYLNQAHEGLGSWECWECTRMGRDSENQENWSYCATDFFNVGRGGLRPCAHAFCGDDTDRNTIGCKRITYSGADSTTS
jgi:hypothetical protein